MRSFGAKLINVVPVLFLVSLLSFFMLDLLPGKVTAILGADASAEEVARLEEDLGFNRPLPVRYAEWVGNAVTGDLGRSYVTRQPVTEAIKERLPVTIQIALLAQAMALVLALPVAMYAARRAGGIFDRVSTGAAFAMISIPNFVLALVLVYLFAVTWQIFPVTGWVRITDDLGANLRSAFLPAVALAVSEFAVYMRITRSDLLATLQDDFILSAKAKGLPSWRILVRHALRPSSFSLITLAGVSLGRLIGGTIIIEVIFSLPGLGRLMFDSISKRDFVMVQGLTLFIATVYVVINLLIDLFYLYLDPRLRR